MTKFAITENQKKSLQRFIGQNKHPELVATYLFYVEQKFQLKPVLFVQDKIVLTMQLQSLKKMVNYGVKLKLKSVMKWPLLMIRQAKFTSALSLEKSLRIIHILILKMLSMIGCRDAKKIQSVLAECAQSVSLFQKTLV